MTSNNSYPLHECVFRDNLKQLSILLRSHKYDIAQKDIHGNSPLHLSVILGHKDCMHLLLAHGAPVKSKNVHGWNPLAEAISYGDRNTISLLLRKLKQQSRELLEQRRPQLLQLLTDLGDFYMELHWDFQSWVPLVSRILPSDTCRIYKKGAQIRVDTTLVDFSEMKWQKGDLTFLFDGTVTAEKSLVFLDNESKVYQRLSYEQSDVELEEEVDILMSSDIVTVNLSTKPITFNRSQSGWLFRGDKRELVGSFYADFYDVGGVIIESRKRREHLSDEDIQRNKSAVESISKGSPSVDCFPTQRRPSLPRPPESVMTWEEYSGAERGRALTLLGRPQISKEMRKMFKATVAMSEDFPMEVTDLLNMLEVLTSMKHFNKLRDFVQMKLPPGFPIKIDVPVLPTITARVTFQAFQFRDNINPAQFTIPSDYRENSSRFRDL
ncbi:ankyrin repeat domain-containing protein 13C-B [Strongylocentrotus purpuratus]|uniref:Ankyrin repeat domain-containing protein n=1 Tax=Strongylocentrotus purpuratus TaxID=7668 RepID=A0A7M7PJ74_STRPU|nr:ankyrin repeat domain-containing protein 13C-B [Strongylocentrotus purpuratus]